MDFSQIDYCLNEMNNNNLFSGCVMLSKNGQSQFIKAYGLASKSYGIANNVRTKFNIASIGKTITGTAVMQLVQNKILNLNATLDTCLPNDLLDKEIAKHVTIEHLLTHTSGLGDYFDSAYNSTYRTQFQNYDDFEPIVRNAKLNFSPGTKWSYSNLGFLVLGYVIQNITDMSYYDYIKKNIFDIIGMNDSGFWLYNEPIDNCATGYYLDDCCVPKWRNTYNCPVIRGTSAGGCFSTVIDLMNFFNAIIDNKLLQSEFSHELITSKPNKNSPNYGYGFFISQDKIGHGGNGTGICSQLTHYCSSGYTLIILSNYSKGASEVEAIFDKMIL